MPKKCWMLFSTLLNARSPYGAFEFFKKTQNNMSYVMVDVEADGPAPGLYFDDFPGSRAC